MTAKLCVRQCVCVCNEEFALFAISERVVDTSRNLLNLRVGWAWVGWNLLKFAGGRGRVISRKLLKFAGGVGAGCVRTPTFPSTADIHHASGNKHSRADAVHFGLPAG